MVAILGQKSSKFFDENALNLAMKAYLPSCPEPHRTQIITLIRIQPWPRRTKLKVLLYGRAHCYIRHRLTDYEKWIGFQGITREEARTIISPELNETFTAWCSATQSDDGS